MSELLKEISFNITKSQEVDLSKPRELKKKRRKRNDDYDYNDDFIESFEGETDLVDIECSLPNFFVYQGPLPYSTKKILNFFKNKPNLIYENDNEVDVLEEALSISKRVKKPNSGTSKKINIIEDKNNGDINKSNENIGISGDGIIDSEDQKKMIRTRKPRNSDKKIFKYKEMIINYLYAKFYKFRENFFKLSIDDKIWFFIVNFLFHRDDETSYRNNLQIIIEDKYSKYSKSESNLRKNLVNLNNDLIEPENDLNKVNKSNIIEDHASTQEKIVDNADNKNLKEKNEIKKIVDNADNKNLKEKNEVKNIEDRNLKEVESFENVIINKYENSKEKNKVENFEEKNNNIDQNKDKLMTTTKEKISNKDLEDLKVQSLDDLTQKNKNYSSPIPFTPSKQAKSSNTFFHSPSIDPLIYPLLKEFFTDNELNLFVSRMISKIDTAFMSITVYGHNEMMYSNDTRRFTGFTDNGFRDECIAYFSSFVVKHYSNNTSQDIIHYYHEAKKSLMDAFLPYMSNKVKILYFVNNYFRSSLEEDKFDY